MSDEAQRLKKIADKIKKNTSLKNDEKVNEIAKAVDELSKLILVSYLENKK